MAAIAANRHARAPEGPSTGLVIGDTRDAAERAADAVAQAAKSVMPAVVGPARQAPAASGPAHAMTSSPAAAASPSHAASRLRRQGIPAEAALPEASTCRVLF